MSAGPGLGERVKRRVTDIAGSMAIVATLTMAGAVRDEVRLPDVGAPARAVNEAVMRPLDTVSPHEAMRDAEVLSETDTILDSMLITKDMPPGIPLELRTGWIDPRLEAIVREVDDVLGGHIDWPNVYVTPNLIEDRNADAVYRLNLDDEAGVTVPTPDDGRGHPLERLGIHIDAEIVNEELATCQPNGGSVRSLLVHELQHAVSHDNSAQLRRAAEINRDPYAGDGFASEGRAEMAHLLYAEAAQRADAGGPRLNELEPTDRREVVREVISRYLTPVEQPSRQVADGRLLEMLRSNDYLHDGNNPLWDRVSDERTNGYINGVSMLSRAGSREGIVRLGW